MSSSWDCERHGAVPPLHVVARPTVEALHKVASSSGVPLWAPLPLLPGWTLTGLATAGDGTALSVIFAAVPITLHAAVPTAASSSTAGK